MRRTGLSEDEKVGLALADNRTSDLSDWDQEMLRKLSEEHDLEPWFDQDDLDELLAVTELEPEEGNTDPDDAPEAPDDPVTKPGDLWILGKPPPTLRRLHQSRSTSNASWTAKKPTWSSPTRLMALNYDSGWQNQTWSNKFRTTTLSSEQVIS